MCANCTLGNTASLIWEEGKTRRAGRTAEKISGLSSSQGLASLTSKAEEVRKGWQVLITQMSKRRCREVVTHPGPNSQSLMELGLECESPNSWGNMLFACPLGRASPRSVWHLRGQSLRNHDEGLWTSVGPISSCHRNPFHSIPTSGLSSPSLNPAFLECWIVTPHSTAKRHW